MTRDEVRELGQRTPSSSLRSRERGWYDKVSQAFVVLLPVQSAR